MPGSALGTHHQQGRGLPGQRIALVSPLQAGQPRVRQRAQQGARDVCRPQHRVAPVLADVEARVAAKQPYTLGHTPQRLSVQPGTTLHA